MKPEWRRAGHATGRLRCKLTLPAIDSQFEHTAKGGDAVTRLRRYLHRHMPTAIEALVDGSIVFSAEVRAQNMSTRWRPLLRWRDGDDLRTAISRVTAVWDELPKEQWPGTYEARLITRRRVGRAKP